MTEIKELATRLRLEATRIEASTVGNGPGAVWSRERVADLRQAASALEALISRSEVMEEAWQPIETAPRDGTRIQIAVIDRAGNVLSDTGKWIEGDVHEEWDEVEDGIAIKLWGEQDDGHWSSNYCLDALDEPTHWRPLAARSALSLKAGKE